MLNDVDFWELNCVFGLVNINLKFILNNIFKFFLNFGIFGGINLLLLSSGGNINDIFKFLIFDKIVNVFKILIGDKFSIVFSGFFKGFNIL